MMHTLKPNDYVIPEWFNWCLGDVATDRQTSEWPQALNGEIVQDRLRRQQVTLKHAVKSINTPHLFQCYIPLNVLLRDVIPVSHKPLEGLSTYTPLNQRSSSSCYMSSFKSCQVKSLSRHGAHYNSICSDEFGMHVLLITARVRLLLPHSAFPFPTKCYIRHPPSAINILF